MGLAFEAIYPQVYPVALKLFNEGMERHWVVSKIFKQFREKYNVPEREIDTAMIDLTISCAENDFKNKLKDHSTGMKIENQNIARLARLNDKIDKFDNIIDITQDFSEDYHRNIDPDKYNVKLKHWHKILWEKQLPYKNNILTLEKRIWIITLF